MHCSWDIDAMDALSDTMKISFLAVYNTTNHLAYDVVKEKRFHVIKYLKKLVLFLFLFIKLYCLSSI